MDKDLKELLKIATDIKRLLIYGLLANGTSQDQIATALGVNQSSISRLFPNGTSGRAVKRG